MRKLIVLAVLLTFVVAAVITVVPVLCHRGGNNPCDIVTLLRGGIRIISATECQDEPTTGACQLAQTMDLK